MSAQPQPSGAPSDIYQTLEHNIMARDQRAACDTLWTLQDQDRPLAEIIRNAVHIHAPYTHVPYHERIDDGYVNFVNNDHCLLSARAAIHLTQLMPEPLRGLPISQTIWYIPSGLDIWNQKLNKAPGHYARAYEPPPGPPPAPEAPWPDQEAEHLSGSLESRLSQWMTLVHRGQVLDAYRVFLGLMEDSSARERVLAELMFAGLIDLQDRVLMNRSYTTGHKSYRARATVEIGDCVGWANAHDVIYAGALDMAVGPRWYSTYEMASNAIKTIIDGETLRAVPYSGASAREAALLQNSGELDAGEIDQTIDALIRGPEPGNIEQIIRLLEAGKSPLRIIEVIQLAAAQVLLETKDSKNFSIPQHCYEYTNTVRWYLDRFSHPQQLKFLLVAATFVNRNAVHQRQIGEAGAIQFKPPVTASRTSPGGLLKQIDKSTLELDTEAALAWSQAYLDSGADTAALVQTLAACGAKIGNDPHNQELAQILLEDFQKTSAPDRNKLLLACVQHTTRHQKYGDYLECYHRYCSAHKLQATV